MKRIVNLDIDFPTPVWKENITKVYIEGNIQQSQNINKNPQSCQSLARINIVSFLQKYTFDLLLFFHWI